MDEILRLNDSLECGLVLAGYNREQVLHDSRKIEEAGFDSLWVGDHISFSVPLMESLTLLSFAAAVTEKVRLATGIYLLPLRHPTLAAKVSATLDVLSGGRLTLGIGVGGEFPAEFEACGIPTNERGARTDEAIGLLRRFWQDEGVSHDGEHFQFGPVSLNPKPLQAGGPKIIVGGRKGPSFRRAGELGDGYISHMCSAEQYAHNLQQIGDHAKQAQRQALPFETAAFLFTFFNDSYEKALDEAVNLLEGLYRRPFRDAAKKYCLLGRPEDCLEQLQTYARAGVRHFVFSVNNRQDEFIEVFEKQIRPQLGAIALV